MTFRNAVLFYSKRSRIFKEKTLCSRRRRLLIGNSSRATLPRWWKLLQLVFVVGAGGALVISGPKVFGSPPLLPFSEGKSDYIYTSLPSDTSLRLLSLQRPRNEQDNTIRCSLKEFEVEDTPDYVALSYTWGPPEKKTQTLETKYPTIYVDSKPFQVTQNLYDALYLFRSLLDVENFSLWIDAICINQQDLHEKSKQVSMMGTIYNQADRVFVWLGKDERGDGPAIARMITRLADTWNQYPKRENWAAMPDFRISDDLDNADLLYQYGIPIWSTQNWIALGLFLNREWFHRLWCAQEIALAKRPEDVRLLYGRTCFVWNDLVAVSLFMEVTDLGRLVHELLKCHIRDIYIQPGKVGSESVALYLISRFLEADVPPGWEELLKIRSGQKWEDLNGYHFLLMLLQILRSREASDERDRVFGLLGMVGHFCKLRSVTTVTLRPDYSQPAVQILKDAAKNILRGTPDTLGFLSLGRSWSPMSDYPSWMIGFAGIETAGKPLTEYLHYDASPGPPVKEDVVRFNGDVLQLRGHEFGTVEEVSLTGEEIADGKFSEYLNLVRNLPLPTRTGQSPGEVLWRVLIGDYDHFHKAAGAVNGSVGKSFLKFLQYMLLKEKLRDIARQTPEEYYEEKLRVLDDLAKYDQSGSMCTSREIKDLIKHCDIGTDNVSDQVQRVAEFMPRDDYFGQSVDAMTGFRRLFRTAEGDLGLGPQSMQPGDRVWILRGARVPFVLRPSMDVDKTHYHLLGEAYVHGVMRGEFVAKQSTLQWMDVGIV